MPIQFGIFNGSAKEKETKVNLWLVSQLMAESPNGQWKKDYNTLISCYSEEFLSQARKIQLKIWTLDLLQVYLSSFSRENLQCTLQQLNRESYIDVQRVILSNILKFIQGTMALFTKLEPTHTSMTSSWLAQLTGAANYGIGEEIHLWIPSNPSTSTTKLSTSNGVLMNLQYLLLSAKMEDSNYGTLLFIKGFIEEEYVGPYLHSEVKKQK